MAKKAQTKFWTEVFGYNDGEDERLEERIPVTASNPDRAADVASEYADMDYVEQVDIYADKGYTELLFTVFS